MRKSLLAAVSLVTSSLMFFAAGVGPAAGDPTSAASAAAYGLSAAGAVTIAPTIVTGATQPPGDDNAAGGPSPALLTVPLGSLALAGAITVSASAHQADDITPVLTGVPATPNTSNPVTLTPVNARGLAKTAGLGLVLTSADPVLNVALTALQQVAGLLTADSVTAEAVARCVNNQPVFETGYQVAGLGGIVGGVLDPTVQALLDTVLNLLGPGSTLGSLISISPGVVTQTATSVAIDGLQINIPLLQETIVISHAEAAMPAGCGVAAAPPTTVAAGPFGTLASTGGEMPFLPIGAAMIGVAFVSYGVIRRSRQTASQ